jgi:hypothetical protein
LSLGNNLSLIVLKYHISNPWLFLGLGWEAVVSRVLT